MMTRFLDPNIARKKQIVTAHFSAHPVVAHAVPTFSIVEFNLTERCNRRCVFCPRVDPHVYPNRNVSIPVALYAHIMQDLAGLSFAGRIVYSAFSEPLLHPQIADLIHLSRQYCPTAGVEIVTNGDLLTWEKLRGLFDAGLDQISVSMYDGPHQVAHFREMQEQAGLRDAQLLLRARYGTAAQQYGMNLSNRAGTVEIPESGVGTLASPMRSSCFYPFYELLIDYDGTVLLCPHDWGKHLCAGTLQEQSVLAVWTGPILTDVRTRLARSDRDFSPCVVCNVAGNLLGQDHFDAWRRCNDTHGNPGR